MLISSAFPTKYIKAADLQGRQVPVTIDRVEIEEVGDGDNKPVLYFQGKDKGCVLNKTNAETIATALGDDTDAWEGQKIILFSMMVLYQGRKQPGIRVIVPPKPKATTRQQVASPQLQQQMAAHESENPADGMDDEIPF